MSRKNKLVKILVGVPAAGKTTWSIEYLAKNPNTVSVSRDYFRYGLRNAGITEPKIENMITELVDETIVKSLMFGLDVIVDATNLKASYLNHFVELVRYKADVEFRVFDISLEKAIERDNNRERKVGEHVIRKMYKNYKDLIDSYPLFERITKRPEHEDKFVHLKQDKSLPEAILVDLDGTLFTPGNRGMYDWDKVDKDDLNEKVADLLRTNKNLGRNIILVSGRDEEAREKTEYCLNFYDIKYDKLFMRPKGSFEKDVVVKKRIFNEDIFGKYNVLFSIDDRLNVCKLWSELGIFCLCVNQHLKEF